MTRSALDSQTHGVAGSFLILVLTHVALAETPIGDEDVTILRDPCCIPQVFAADDAGAF